uniref:HSF-type DNA-binding domain-containing protein n=1 Tax=Arion vulgaris TaxID=1028688 RepID=A0A0B6Z4B9_9EUPU
MYAAVENNSGNVPAFLIKLWTLVEDPSTDELIHWDSSGVSFHVYDQQRFSREILPLYFKHNNIASFIRQLNMYGFRKVTHIDQGGLKIEKDDLQFQHQYFQRGERDMLQFIKRKVSAQAVRTTDHLVAAKTDEVSRVLSEMKHVKSKQDAMDENLEYIKRENKLLWREVALLRQKHHKQQQIVNKLIQFLVSLVSSNRSGLSIPTIRRAPLAINDVSQFVQSGAVSSENSGGVEGGKGGLDNKRFIVSAASPSEPNKEDMTDDLTYTIESPKISDYLLSPTPSINGPIIHELTDSPQTILVPINTIGLMYPGTTASQQNVVQTSTQATSTAPSRTANVVLIPAVQPQPTATTVAIGNQGDSLNFLMSPKIEAAPSLEDALTFGLNVPSSSATISHMSSPLQTTTNTGLQQKRKRKGSSATSPSSESGESPEKRQSHALQMTATQRHPMSDAQAVSLSNIMMANSDLDFTGSGGAGASNVDASLAVSSSKDDEFKLSSDQLDLLSSDLDGLKGILQDQYKVDPTFLMELFDSSNPWPVIPEKDLDDLKEDRDEAGTSDLDHGNITGTELVEYNPKDELFPELMDDNMIGDIDDID